MLLSFLFSYRGVASEVYLKEGPLQYRYGLPIRRETPQAKLSGQRASQSVTRWY